MIQVGPAPVCLLYLASLIFFLLLLNYKLSNTFLPKSIMIDSILFINIFLIHWSFTSVQ